MLYILKPFWVHGWPSLWCLDCTVKNVVVNTTASSLFGKSWEISWDTWLPQKRLLKLSGWLERVVYLCHTTASSRHDCWDQFKHGLDDWSVARPDQPTILGRQIAARPIPLLTSYTVFRLMATPNISNSVKYPLIKMPSWRITFVK